MGGFEWIDTSDAEQSILSFVRRAKDRDDLIVVVCNFTPVPRLGYRVGLPKADNYEEIMNSDWQQYGGSGVSNGGQIVADHMGWQNCDYSASLNLPPLGVFMLKPVG